MVPRRAGRCRGAADAAGCLGANLCGAVGCMVGAASRRSRGGAESGWVDPFAAFYSVGCSRIPSLVGATADIVRVVVDCTGRSHRVCAGIGAGPFCQLVRFQHGPRRDWHGLGAVPCVVPLADVACAALSPDAGAIGAASMNAGIMIRRHLIYTC